MDDADARRRNRRAGGQPRPDDALPRNASGKVLKTALRGRFG